MIGKQSIFFSRNKNQQAGFTLVELSIVLITGAILLTPLLSLYTNYRIEQEYKKTRENVEEAKSRISSYYNEEKEYPCPADPALSPEDPNYGVANCTVTGGITSAPGTRNASDLVLIGAVPIRTIRDVLYGDGALKSTLSDEASLDYWGNKLTYAVTSSMTSSGTYKYYNGQIRAINEFGNSTAGIHDNGHFVVLSHGKKGIGAYTKYGVQTFPCAATKEGENCDGDATFLSALGNYEANTANYYDDFTVFHINNASVLWDYIPNPNPPPPTDPDYLKKLMTDNLRNRNNENVGIKTDSPTEKLTVGGTLTATNNIKTDQVCNEAGTKCFDVDSISGSGMKCSGKKIMIGIQNGGPICVNPTFGTVTDTTCPTGSWVRGIMSDGSVICYP